MRLNSGPVQIDDDWPGVFIRGDEIEGLRQVLMLMSQKTDIDVSRYIDMVTTRRPGHPSIVRLTFAERQADADHS